MHLSDDSEVKKWAFATGFRHGESILAMNHDLTAMVPLACNQPWHFRDDGLDPDFQLIRCAPGRFFKRQPGETSFLGNFAKPPPVMKNWETTNPTTQAGSKCRPYAEKMYNKLVEETRMVVAGDMDIATSRGKKRGTLDEEAFSSSEEEEFSASSPGDDEECTKREEQRDAQASPVTKRNKEGRDTSSGERKPRGRPRKE